MPYPVAACRNLNFGSVWTPASLSSLVAWFDPSYGVYANSAAKFVGSSSQNLSIGTSVGTSCSYNTDWSVSMWIKHVSVPAHPTSTTFFTKAFSGGYPFLKLYFQGTSNLNISLWGDSGTASPSFSSSDTWYHLTVSYSGTSDKKFRLYKNGVLDQTSAATTGTWTDGASGSLTVGNNTAAGSTINVDSCGLWNRALSAADALALYNSGSGKTYADLTTAEKVSLVSWYDFATTASLGTDAHGSNTLTNTNSVTCDAGIVAGLAVANDPVYRWYARNNAAIYAEAAALGNRPLKKSDHLLSDGLDDGMLIASGMLTAYRTGNSTLVVIFDRVEFGATKVISGMTSNHRTFRITSTDGAQALDGGAAVGAGSIAGTNTVMVASAFDVSNSKLKQSINAGAYTETAATINTTDSSIGLFSRDGAGNLPIGIKGRHFLFFSSVLSTSSLSLLKTYFGL